MKSHVFSNTSINSMGGKGTGFFPFLYVLLILVLFAPYVISSAYPLLSGYYEPALQSLLIVLTMVISLFIGKAKTKISNTLFAIFILQIIWRVLNSIDKGNGFGLRLFVLPSLALLLVVFIDKTCGLYSFFKKYNVWIVLMTTMGSLAFVLSRFGVLHPLYPFMDMSDKELMYNWGLTFTQEGTNLFAYCGFFDEPGAIAQWSMFALLFNQFFLKNEKMEILLIATTMLTFSMGYYIQAIVYILFFHVFNKNKNKNNKYTTILILAIIALFLYLGFNSQTTDGDVYEKTIGRITQAYEDSRTSGIAIDDREKLTINALNEFRNNPWLGTHNPNATDFGNNIYEPLALYGIIGTFFLYLPFIVLLIKSLLEHDKDLMKCIIIIILGFTHRPFHFNLLFIFIIYSFVAMYYQKNITMARTSWN